MNNNYNIYKFSYVCGDLIMAIFARDVETADRIIQVENNDSEFHWKRKRFGFKKRFVISTPPLDVELMQLESAEEDLKKRKAIKNGTYQQSEEEKAFFKDLDERCRINQTKNKS